MKEKYRQEIHRIVDLIDNEGLLKRIYTYVITVIKK